jgi:hypothetical protein
MTARLFCLVGVVAITIATPSLADCASDVRALVDAMPSHGPYRAQIVANGSTELSGEAILPDRMHLKMDGMEILKTPNGVWIGTGQSLMKAEGAMRDQFDGIISKNMSVAMGTVSNEECLGSAAYEGGNYDLYKYATQAEISGSTVTSKVSMYVNNKGQPEWLDIEAEVIGVTSIIKQHITYDPNIKIADPQ